MSSQRSHYRGFWASREESDEIEALADEWRTTRSEAMRRAVREALERERAKSRFAVLEDQ